MAKARTGFLPELFGGLGFKAIGGAKPGADSATAISHVLANTPIFEGWGSLYGDGEGGWDFDSTVAKALERNLWAFRCVDVIASAQARLPIKFKQGDPVDGKDYTDDKLSKLLNRRPNSYEDAYQFRYRLSGHLLLSKRGAFIEPVWDNMGRLKELHLIPPDVIEPIPDEKTFIRGYRVIKKYRWGMDEIPADKLVWLRLRPHPLNPYMQMTPLMSAGLSVDTDFMARLYNRNYLANGGKNGLLVMVQGLVGATDAEELRSRFMGGPGSAGRPTVIEAGSITVEDLGATPHDAQWLEAIAGSKEEILLAFGVPESQMGNASGATFDNADAESEQFWTQTETNHCDGIARGLDPLTGDVDDDKFCVYDYSGVAVLQRQERLKHDKSLEEFNAGLITWNEYREATGKKKFSTPESDGAFITITGKGALGASKAIMDAAGALTPLGQPSMEDQQKMAQDQQQAQLQAQGHQAALQGATRQFGNQLAARTFGMTGPPRLGFGSGGGSQFRPGAGGFQPSKFGTGGLAGRKGLSEIPEEVEGALLGKGEHPYLTEHTAAEAEIAATLEAWSDQQGRVIPERVMHAKVRMHTRHWDDDGTGKGMGTKALNPNYIVEVERWADDLGGMLRKGIERIADREARRAARDMDTSAFTKVMAAKGMLANPEGKTHLARVFGEKDALATLVKSVADPMERLVKDAARRQSQRVIAAITQMDADGASASEIQAKIRKMTGKRSSWQKTLSRYLTTAVIEGTRSKTYGLAGTLLKKTWNTVGDERVRHTHEDADGQVRAAGSNFKVGSAWLFHPGDPSGPIGETINCRCWAEYEISDKHGGLFDRIAHMSMADIVAGRKDVSGGLASHPVARGIGTVQAHATVLGRNEDEEDEDEH